MQTILNILTVPTSIFLALAAIFFAWHAFKAKDKFNKAGDAVSAFFMMVSLILIWR